MFLAATIQSKILDLLPLVCTFVCFGLMIASMGRGIIMLIVRARMLKDGLHASSAVCRHLPNGEACYLPVYSYTGENGELFDIMEETPFSSEEEALQARRPLVYTQERPDAAVSRGPLFLFLRPMVFLLLSGVFAWGTCYAISFIPD